MSLPETCTEDLFRCVSYLFIWPIFMFFGLLGSTATLVILSRSKFNTNTFYYLKALSMSDMMYLVSALGYLYEMFFLDTYSQLSTVAKAKYSFTRQIVKRFVQYYLTYFDILICNTFIGTSGMIIILLTIDRYRCICQPTLPRHNQPGLYCGLALLVSLFWQVPRLFVNTTTASCELVESNVR